MAGSWFLRRSGPVAILAAGLLLTGCWVNWEVSNWVDYLVSEYRGVGVYPTGLVAEVPSEADCPAITVAFATPYNRNGEFRSATHELLHTGTDWAMDPGTPILAIADGVIDQAAENSGDARGNFVVIKHDWIEPNVFSSYNHLSSIAVTREPGAPVFPPPPRRKWEAGMTVRKGQVIGYVGDTGANVTFPHLHLSVYGPGGQGTKLWGKNYRKRIDYLQFLSGDMSPIWPPPTATAFQPVTTRSVPVAYVDDRLRTQPPDANVIWPFRCRGIRSLKAPG